MNKKLFFSLLIIGLIIGFFLTYVNRIQVRAIVDNENVLIVNTSKQELLTPIYINNKFQRSSVELFENLTALKISTKNPTQLKLKSINVLSTVLPFMTFSNNLEMFFEPHNVKIEKIDNYSLLTFEQGSYLQAKTMLFISMACLRLLTIILLGFIISGFLYFVLLNYKKFPIWLLIIVFFLPIVLSPVKTFTLNGESVETTVPKFSFKDFNQRIFQKQFESFLNNKLTLNNLNIRTLNTIFYYTLNKTFGFNQNILVGKENYLYDNSFINLQIMDNLVKTDAIETCVKEIKLLQDKYQKQGKTFVVLITPTKTIKTPNYIPARYNLKNNHIIKNYDAAIKIFEKYNVNVINTIPYIDERIGNHIYFSKGGIHWGDYPKYLATNCLLEGLNKYGNYNFKPIEIDSIIKDNHPIGEDTDYAELTNLLITPLNYEVEHVTVKKAQKTSDVNLKIITGSFWWGIDNFLAKSYTFKNIHTYFYLKNYKRYYNDDMSEAFLDKEIVQNDNELIKDINSGDIIILEFNQPLLDFTQQNYYKKFIELNK